MRLIFASVSFALFLGACSDQSEGRDIGGPVQISDYETADPTDSTPAVHSFGVDARPVRVGFDGPEVDACGSYGVIEGLNPDGDNFLSVRSAPNLDAEELDRLSTGTGVSLCESVDGWLGIVYEGSGTPGMQCGTGSPVSAVQNYSGPCRSGWVSERFVDLVAG